MEGRDGGGCRKQHVSRREIFRRKLSISPDLKRGLHAFFPFLVQRVLVTADLPSWDLQLRSDPPSYALGATTNYHYLLLLTRTVFQPLSLYSVSSIGGSFFSEVQLN